MTQRPAPQSLSIDDIVITRELSLRTVRERSPRLEVDALHALAAQLPLGEAQMLDELMATALRLCGAGTAGVSLLQRTPEGGEVFRWVSVKGALRDGVGGVTPRDFSPCGTCLQRGSAQLFDRPGRVFKYLEPAGITEGLVVPLRAGTTPLGTLWVVGHDDSARFDREDVRILQSLANFAAAAIQLAVAGDHNERRLLEITESRRRADELIALLGHELRTPLAPIALGLELLRRREAPADIARPLATVERQVAHLVRLVDEILDVSRVTRGAIELQREPLLLESAISRAVELARPLIDERKHELHFDAQRGIVVNADSLRLEQMIANLIMNAARFTPRGGSIVVTCEASADRAVLAVSDTGVGLAADSLEKIFEPFVQLERDPACAPGGLGVGLTLTRRLAELHGGSVRAESEGKGLGATFELELPCRRVGLAPAPPKLRPVHELRVLIVDGCADSAGMISDALETAGCATLVAANGSDALDAAPRFRPDVVLLDLRLADVDGCELARRLRRVAELQVTRLISISGGDEEADRLRSAGAGFHRHLGKPVALDALLDALRT